MPATGTFTKHPSLVEALPPLVRKQRTLAARIAMVAQDLVDEKALREQIDLLLVAAGLKKSDVVTCNGYDVRHNERDGKISYDPVTILTLALAEGYDGAVIERILAASKDTGEVAKFATITPSKGAKVRT